MTFSPLIIWAKATFFFEQLFSVVARTWLGLKSDSFFLGPKFWFLTKKSNFCPMTPILVDDPFLALGMTVNFPPWERFFDFPFQSYSCFRKKIWLTRQKVFPPPTVGVPSASKSPSAISAQALRLDKFLPGSLVHMFIFGRNKILHHSTFMPAHSCAIFLFYLVGQLTTFMQAIPT